MTANETAALEFAYEIIRRFRWGRKSMILRELD